MDEDLKIEDMDEDLKMSKDQYQNIRKIDKTQQIALLDQIHIVEVAFLDYVRAMTQLSPTEKFYEERWAKLRSDLKDRIMNLNIMP